jgi:V-type H+-transporting ATPase subunit E
MIDFINQSGKERVLDIDTQAKQDFAVGKEQAIENKKKLLTESFKNKLDNAEVQLKIKKSADQNKARIERMRAINDLVEQLLVETKKAMAEKFRQEP